MSKTPELEISKEAFDALAQEAEQATLARHIQEGEEWLAARKTVTTRKDMLQASLNAVQGTQTDWWHALRNLERLVTSATLLVNALDHLEAVERGQGVGR